MTYIELIRKHCKLKVSVWKNGRIFQKKFRRWYSRINRGSFGKLGTKRSSKQKIFNAYVSRMNIFFYKMRLETPSTEAKSLLRPRYKQICLIYLVTSKQFELKNIGSASRFFIVLNVVDSNRQSSISQFMKFWREIWICLIEFKFCAKVS